MIRRQLTDKGRSSAWIQDIPVSTQALKQGSEFLLDVFSQHEHHSLLSPSRHVHYLDQFVENKALLSSYQGDYETLRASLSHFQELCENLAKAIQDKDYLEFRRQQFVDLNPSFKDFEQLKELCELASEGLANQSLLREVSRFLALGDDLGVADQVRSISRLLSKAKPPARFADYQQELGRLLQSSMIFPLSFLDFKTVKSSMLMHLTLLKNV